MSSLKVCSDRDALLLLALAEKERRRREIEINRPSIEPVTGLLNFTHRTHHRYRPAWFHHEICKVCDRIIRGEQGNTIISMPPRHGKTEIVSRRLPAYLLGLNPNAQIIATSYSAALAARNNRDVQRIIDNPEYHVLFPGTQLNSKNIKTTAQGSFLRNSEMFEVVNHRGSYRAAGVGGGITGMGFGGSMTTDIYGNPVIGGVGIIDDYLKNRQEAESLTIRDKIWEWYTSTFRTRCEDGAPIIVIATQWHNDDLIGRLIQSAKSDPKADQWTVIKFPAIATNDPHELDHRQEGEALWEEKYPLDELNKIRSSIGAYDWEALYQQNPTPRGGGIIKASWLHERTCPQHINRWIISVDATFKETKKGSFVAIQAWIQLGGWFILCDQWRKRAGFVETSSAIANMRNKWAQHYGSPQAILIEDKANGPAIIDTLKGQIPGILAVTPNGSKIARLEAVSPAFESGNVQYCAFDGVEDWIKEITAAPFAPHDDQIDCTSQALQWLMNTMTNIEVYTPEDMTRTIYSDSFSGY